MVARESLETHFPTSATSPSEILNRSLSLWNSFTLGLAMVSPVVGLYAIIDALSFARCDGNS